MLTLPSVHDNDAIIVCADKMSIKSSEAYGHGVHTDDGSKSVSDRNQDAILEFFPYNLLDPTIAPKVRYLAIHPELHAHLRSVAKSTEAVLSSITTNLLFRRSLKGAVGLGGRLHSQRDEILTLLPKR